MLRSAGLREDIMVEAIEALHQRIDEDLAHVKEYKTVTLNYFDLFWWFLMDVVAAGGLEYFLWSNGSTE